MLDNRGGYSLYVLDGSYGSKGIDFCQLVCSISLCVIIKCWLMILALMYLSLILCTSTDHMGSVDLLLLSPPHCCPSKRFIKISHLCTNINQFFFVIFNRLRKILVLLKSVLWHQLVSFQLI